MRQDRQSDDLPSRNRNMKPLETVGDWLSGKELMAVTTTFNRACSHAFRVQKMDQLSEGETQQDVASRMEIGGFIVFAAKLSKHFGLLTLCSGESDCFGGCCSSAGENSIDDNKTLDVIVRLADGVSSDKFHHMFEFVFAGGGGKDGKSSEGVWELPAKLTHVRVRGFPELARGIPADATTGSLPPVPCLHATEWCEDDGEWVSLLVPFPGEGGEGGHTNLPLSDSPECQQQNEKRSPIPPHTTSSSLLLTSGDAPGTKNGNSTAADQSTSPNNPDSATPPPPPPKKASKSSHRKTTKNESRGARLVSLLLDVIGYDRLCSTSVGVLDIAGGGTNSGVAFELGCRYGIPCTTIDPRPVVLNRLSRNVLKFRTNSRLKLEPGMAVSPITRLLIRRYREWKPSQIQDWFLWPLEDGADVSRNGDSSVSRVDETPTSPTTDNDAAANGVAGGLGQSDPEGGNGYGNTTPSLSSLLSNCTAIIGMHPDQATDAIIHAGLALAVPWVVVPCCVFPSQFHHRRIRGSAVVKKAVAAEQPQEEKREETGEEETRQEEEGGGEGGGGGEMRPVRSYEDLCAYILESAEGVQQVELEFEGRNRAFYWVPPLMRE